MPLLQWIVCPDSYVSGNNFRWHTRVYGSIHVSNVVVDGAERKRKKKKKKYRTISDRVKVPGTCSMYSIDSSSHDLDDRCREFSVALLWNRGWVIIISIFDSFVICKYSILFFFRKYSMFSNKMISLSIIF